eukprot:7386382-Prymnesium_polylepis.1
MESIEEEMAAALMPAVQPAVQLAAVQQVNQLDIAQRHEQTLAIFAPHKEGLKPKHAHLFFTEVVTTNPNNSQQMKGSCFNCKQSVSSTGGTRFASHLAGCPLVPAQVRQAFKALQHEKEKKSCAKRDALTLANEEADIMAKEHEAQQVALKQQCIRAGLKTAEVAAADVAIANFMYANGISFSVASTEATSRYRTMVRAIQNAPPGYVPPTEHKFSGPLLDECYSNMWRAIEARDPDGALKQKFGSTYVSDGWDSCDHLPLINSAFITNNDGGMYWRSVDTSGKYKSAEYCVMLMIQDIYDYGPTNVVLIITDTCATMAKAWGLVEDDF